MEPEEARRFMQGEGCPACGFGDKCVRCSGSGMERSSAYPNGDCACFGSRTLTVWRFPNSTYQGWHYGYKPKVRRLGDDLDGQKEIGKGRPVESLNGWGREQMIACPFCAEEADPYIDCKRTGKFSPPPGDEDDRTLTFLMTLDDATDGHEAEDAAEVIAGE
jgi:hypothetical protein